jgi:putative Mg2+ transporter-C (MgtC) family protein
MVELVSRADSYPDSARTDPIRIIEAVTSGVAFLAAGMIIFTGDKVRGLTTGAGLWLSASVGLAAGLGLWPLAGLSTLLALIVTRLLGKLERHGEQAVARWHGDDGSTGPETGEDIATDDR